MEKIEAAKEKERGLGRIGNFVKKHVESIKNPQTFHITGYVEVTRQYKKERKGETTLYDKKYHDVDQVKYTIQAANKQEAEKQFIQTVTDDYTNDIGGEVYDYVKSTVDGVKVQGVVSQSSLNASSETRSLMKHMTPIDYNFIPADHKYLKTENFCVIDQIDQIYGNKKSTLKKENFIRQCEEIEGRSDIDGNHNINTWSVNDGVRVSTLHEILKKNNISFYAYDIMNQCFEKYISTSRNYPALIYYSVNNHMYWISDKNKALSLSCRARDIEVNINTEMSNMEVEEINIYLDEHKQVKPIFENVMVKDLMDERYKNSIIIYNYRIEDAYNNDLTCELHEIIKIHNYIPSKIRNTGYATTRIIFNKNEQNIILTIDENENRHKEINYKNVIEICKTHNIEFKNQTMGALVQEVRNNFFDGPTSKRVKLNKARRNELHLTVSYTHLTLPTKRIV